MKKIFGVLCLIVFATGANAGDAAKGQSAAATCSACHGGDGNAVLPGAPSLAGQSEKYLIKQINDYKSGVRVNNQMQPMVANLSDEDTANIAAFYAGQKIQHMAVADEYIEAGNSLYMNGDADRGIAACTACHGVNGNGMAAAGFPALGGQKADYTKAQLEAFRSGARSNDENNVMRDIVAKMSDEQIKVLSNYLVGLH